MAAKKKSKRPKRTAIVPRVVFQTMVAVSVVPAMGTVAAGCGMGVSPATDAGFSVAAPLDGGHDGGTFAVAVDASPDAGRDASFGVADGSFGVADAGFGVADAGFSVAAPHDGGGFSVLVAPHDANTAS